MKKNYRRAFLFALIASFSGLAAEDQEVAMSKVEEGCPRPDDCQGSAMEFDYYRHDPNDAEYDVYTQGPDGDECDAPCKPSSCAKSNKCRRGAAKAAQE